MLQKILDFFRRLFGMKPKTKKVNSPARPVAKPVSPKIKKETVSPTPPPKPKPQPKPKPAPVHFEPPQVTLALAMHDEDVSAQQIEESLKLYHRHMGGVRASVKKDQFRHGDLNKWIPAKKVAGKPVRVLQKFLQDAGFLPTYHQANGVFGYATQAATRLFQEYVRTVEGKTEIGMPDGVIGKNGWQHIKRWTENHLTAEAWKRNQPSAEYREILGLLQTAKSHYLAEPFLSLTKVDEQVGKAKTDTLATSDWTTSADEIHLIGIRRRETDNKGLRENDDVFILLINGMVFKFWGSTDPNHGRKARKDEAFLVEGQHKFRFGWHNHSTENKIYQGLNPHQHGVLVVRDWDNDNKLTDKDITGRGIDPRPNTTINIHWTGAGQGPSGTWSAGCQVIAGESYINPAGELVNCSAFAAAGTRALNANKSAVSLQKTKGAYNVFTDILLLYRPETVDYLYYTLGRDGILEEEKLMDDSTSVSFTDTLRIFKLPEELA